jgi:3'-5' exonuclease
MNELRAKKNLHPASQWKRILSACDFWFSKKNLESDSLMRKTLLRHKGWIPLCTLLTFPKFHVWVTEQMLIDAFSCSAAERYVLTYDKKLAALPQLVDDQSENLEEHRWLQNESEEDEDEFGEEDDEWDEHQYESGEEMRVLRRFVTVEPSVGEAEHKKIEKAASRSEQETDTSSSDQQAEPKSQDDVLSGNPQFSRDDHDMMELYAITARMIADATGTVVGESVPEAAVIDYSKRNPNPTTADMRHALVRHKRVSLNAITIMDRHVNREEIELASNFGIYDSLNADENLEYFSDEEQDHCNKRKQLPRYRANRKVQLIKNFNELQEFCKIVAESAKNAANTYNDPNASAIGLDVEYCTLELDIRPTLPAMLQLSPPENTKPVGLVWLDKFCDHGRGMLNAPECAPLTQLLADTSILKVGVGTSKDVRNLARWWGITDKEYAAHLVSGVIDLESEERLTGMSLQDMCESVLDCFLFKKKGKTRPKDYRKRKRTPTSHWRTDNITGQMKEYAADDVACGIDVWMKVKGFRLQ